MLTPTKDTLNFIISHSLKIINDHTGIQTNKEGALAQNFLTKITISSITIFNIIFPKPIKIPLLSPNHLELYDLTSANVLTRSLFESYINFHSLLFDYSTLEEKELKFILWDRHVYTERIKMSSYRSNVLYNKNEDEQLVDNLIIQIKANDYFKNLSITDQKRIIKENKYSLQTVPEKSIRAGIVEHHSRFLYKFLSNYAHSEPFSIMQFNAVTNSKEAQDLVEGLPLIYTEAFLSLTLHLYSQIYKDVESYIDGDRVLKTKIHFYSNWLGKVTNNPISLRKH